MDKSQKVSATEHETEEEQSSSPSPSTPQRTRGGSVRARSGSSADQKAQIHEMQKQSERVQQHKHVSNAITTFFHDLHDLIEGEMQVGFNELQLLEQMNQMVEKKYSSMNDKASDVHEQINKMRQQCLFVPLWFCCSGFKTSLFLFSTTFPERWLTDSMKFHIWTIVDEKCQPYFEQIDQIDEAVNELANVAKYLDQYSRNLGKSTNIHIY